MKFSLSPERTARSGFTMVEMLVVIAILGILVAILVPSLGRAKQIAEAMVNTTNLKNIATATLAWAGDHGNKLPSPQYPGGEIVPGTMEPADFFPDYWDLCESGLWIDGVVFGHMYLSEQARREGDENGDNGDNGNASSGGYEVDESGTHLKGTLFENTQAVKADPEEQDWHKHSYAMNTNLQYDRRKKDSPEPWLTEKTLSNLLFMPNALLYIENKESNLIDFDDREAIIETMEERWEGRKVIAAFLDGHAERLNKDQIPEDDPNTDRESSRFWRGVDIDRNASSE
jgi:prepilin-type N-terminal cleavage/methylation domain-containing protein